MYISFVLAIIMSYFPWLGQRQMRLITECVLAWTTWRVSMLEQNVFKLSVYLGSIPDFSEVRVVQFLVYIKHIVDCLFLLLFLFRCILSYVGIDVAFCNIIYKL